ncbi:hypothetical protein MPTK1_5g14340 [Marchantia polymorpha subsp. ruderalis]|uniref:Uncharacterized protein n=2 Tax=Marchantia polymorpha TaxID=3197 RepID=A0AAF6BIA5_MARPO|nr:hypothetical protein MARPO_0032s0126 [Marchantia polymorpha]BBN11739.1 hypothetical protein Mp_5g14340 [Marchantia polymorpha subsp. ruderalis]|eukprot:PTQ41956.1 hypothetical protein MARPO_0032s0126 [Marchantia polymorpha]
MGLVPVASVMIKNYDINDLSYIQPNLALPMALIMQFGPYRLTMTILPCLELQPQVRQYQQILHSVQTHS